VPRRRGAPSPTGPTPVGTHPDDGNSFRLRIAKLIRDAEVMAVQSSGQRYRKTTAARRPTRTTGEADWRSRQGSLTGRTKHEDI
jgi:hypothetical protein